MPSRWRFDGWIAGAGTRGGTRLVLGHWPRSPLGPFSDVMVAHPDGMRELLAPSRKIADFVSATYSFDSIRLTSIDVNIARATGITTQTSRFSWTVHAGPLRWRFITGPDHWLAPAVRVMPRRIATSYAWARLTNPAARLLMPGVQTIGRAGGRESDRTEWYGATGVRLLATSDASWDGHHLGDMAPMTPAPNFGFSASPPQPSLTRLVSTVQFDLTP